MSNEEIWLIFFGIILFSYIWISVILLSELYRKNTLLEKMVIGAEKDIRHMSQDFYSRSR